jgi:hypothetical protein
MLIQCLSNSLNILKVHINVLMKKIGNIRPFVIFDVFGTQKTRESSHFGKS